MYKRAGSKVEKLAKQVIAKDYPAFKYLKIIYLFRKKSKQVEDGMIAAAQVRVLPNKIRDIYKYDVEIEISKPVWSHLSEKGRLQLLWHEFQHLEVSLDEKKRPEKDKEDRIIVNTRDHDLVLKTFRKEIRRFGMTAADIDALKFLYKVYKDWKKGKIRERKVEMLGEEAIDFD